MSIKIKNIRIKGIRGAKKSIDIPLDGKSILIYGDNGSGKSSIADSIEWFYTDKVSHLSGNEIDLKEALRNSTLPDEDISEVSLTFSNSNLDNSKTLLYKRNKLTVESLNNSQEFNKYIGQSSGENILLRYQYLTDFIDNTKSEKLKYLSDIIGFSEVTKKKDVLKKSYNSLKIEIRNQNFEAQINTQKQVLIEKIGAAINHEQKLIDILNEKIKPLKIGLEIKSFSDIDKVLETLKKPANNKLINEFRFLDTVANTIATLQTEIDFINTEYRKYYSEFDLIANDVEGIMQTFLGELLKIGDNVLARKYHKDETCPLCLQPKNLEELRSEIVQRLVVIEQSAKKKASFDKAKQMVLNIAIERIKRLDILLSDKLIDEKEYSIIKTGIYNLKEKIHTFQTASNVKVTSGDKLPAVEDCQLILSDFSILEKVTEKNKVIQETIKKENSAVLYSNISASKDAFSKIKNFEIQKDKLEKQRKCLEIIYNEFVKKQKEALENFITAFSGKINEYYQYMNPGEPFQEIKIVTIGDEDELNGITIEYKYNDNWVSPPQKFFSESHLNCFGLSFFLASVEAFNNINKFILLDDVISSFDSAHRKRFADLIFEKFSKFQIILLTHEKEWFSGIVSPLAKKKGWMINELQWSDSEGTHLEDKPNELKELIEFYIGEGKSDGLGNPMRRYLEHSLKEICFHLDVKVSFQFNDRNEKRMPDELLNALKSRIKDKSQDLKSQMNIIDRVASSALLGNLLSHDNPFNPKIGDLKAFWTDVKELEMLFICQHPDCKKSKVSYLNYDTVEKKIRCGCGKTKYDWK